MQLSTTLLLTLLVAAPWLATAQTRSDEGLRTGRAHLVTVTASPNEGLEVGIPRDSAFAKGIAFDVQGRWDQSHTAYREAQAEFQKLIVDRPSWAKMVRGWLLKAEFQMDQSQRLRYPIYYRYGPPSASALYYRGEARRNKWLGIRAFTGRTEKKLQQEILEDLQKSLQQITSYDSARIALAAMYHETGEHTKGRQEFAKVQTTGRLWLAVEMAYYYCAAGEIDKSLEMLERAVNYNPSNKRYILRSNDFDRIRANPRFKRIVGEP